jgi:predicted nucleic acid-binding protein
MTGQEASNIVLLDADVIRHFLKGSKILLLPKILSDQLVILDVVKNELCNSPHLVTPVNNFVLFCKIEVRPFPSDANIIKEYANLRKSFGDGESACMAYAKYNSCCIASSNLTEIKYYCTRNNIQYLTTMDILVEAFQKGIMTEGECDLFIAEVKKKGSKLPANYIKEYIKLNAKLNK